MGQYVILAFKTLGCGIRSRPKLNKRELAYLLPEEFTDRNLLREASQCPTQ